MGFSRFAVRILGLSVCGLVACAPTDTATSETGASAGAAVDHALQFAQRPTPSQRLEEDGVGKAFMVEAPQTGSDLGWGWSIERDQPIPTECVQFVPRSYAAQEARIAVSEARDSQQLAQSMDISAAVSVKAIGYQASGKAKFAQETRVNSFSTTLVIKAEVRNGAQYAAPVTTPAGHTGDAVVLTPAAADMARRDIDTFRRTCGEGFVSARMTGAEAYAVVDIQTRSKTARQSAEAKVSGEGWGAKVDAAFKSDSTATSGSSRTNITFYQAGGEGKDLPSDAASIKARIEALARDAQTAGKVYALEITPYQVLENFPRGRELSADSGETDEIAEAWGLNRTVYDDVSAVMAAPVQFEMPVAECAEGASEPSACKIVFKVVNDTDLGHGESTMDMLGALQDVALRSLDRIELGAKQCLQAGQACNFDPSALRSSYAVRTGLPLPRCWLGTTAAAPSDKSVQAKTTCKDDAGDAQKLSAQRAFQLRDAARQRCGISSLAEGCISNAEINGWAERTGFVPFAAANTAAMQRAEAALKGKAPFITGDADRPDALTLWVPPAYMRATRQALNGAAPSR